MPTWIFGIDADNPEHWEYAKRRGFWDMTTRRAVSRGDRVYFWLAKGSLLGLVRATSDIYEISPGTPMPWNIDDDKRDNYRYRFDLDVLAAESVGAPTWTQLRENTGVTGATNFGPRRVPEDGERWLWAQVIGTDAAQAEGEDLLLDRVDSLGDLTTDERQRVFAEVTVRKSQNRFRLNQLRAWDERCLITGPQPTTVLEAAHIQPYRGEAAHAAGNGILLRADLHRLFDAYLVTLIQDGDGLVVRVAPELRDTQYGEFDGRGVDAVPDDRDYWPHPDSISTHNAQCLWLEAATEAH